MAEGEGWMMRPILRQMLPFKALDDPAYDLADFVFACEALDVEAENSFRVHKALQKGNK